MKEWTIINKILEERLKWINSSPEIQEHTGENNHDMTAQKLKEHKIGINQMFVNDMAECDFDKMLAQGADLNI